ncbi:MAG: Sulfurtransferase [uncultured Sulfurovum sp.]|uniref:Sulfurtransferase n=1 Tax=uncultured Sulfurovum sp. TaxID=269237 RepID=A0A6S6SWV9_9BACT|nr:MAG: Sulfurtransferase [uncultured Sulfurovum sp.]
MNDKFINVVTWLLMAIMLTYFAYYKGWILNNFENISPQKAYALLEQSSDILLVDVRSKKEFSKDHIKNSIHIQMNELVFKEIKSQKILVYSERGERSVEASRVLSKRGFQVFNLEGGVVFWIRAGYELEE